MTEINDRENKTIEFWKKAKIFEKSVEKPANLEKPEGDYVFYDGPPFVTGLPHYGSILPSIVKDTVPRYWTMKGYKVERKWGWDCHGLPAENKVEKDLNLQNKKDIEALGIDKFIGACKDYVNNVSSEWKWYIERIARWVDMENDYRTMDINFMESVIWIFKELYEKSLIYEGYRTSLHCPRCATPLSKFEITMDAGSYKDVTEQSIVIKFKLKNPEKLGLNKKTNILAWTTTPWTLPGNLALAINKKVDYLVVSGDDKDENYIVAKERANQIIGEGKYNIIKEIKGKELVDLEYEALFDLGNEVYDKNDKTYKIYDAEFVSIEDGTGVVHIAPNFGEEDFVLGQEKEIPMIELMDENGNYTSEAGKNFEGEYFKDMNKKVTKQLSEEDKIFSKFNVTHSYPFCYRCGTPLIYKAQKAWYLNIDKIRKNMLKTNDKINWVPEHFKEGRFKYNIETAPHWCLSRSRYWGSPIPVWRCEECGEIKVVGSIKEIEELSGKPVKELHKPDIDEHEFDCSAKGCNGKMKRVPEIFDCWFESGSMPYGQWHYPFEKEAEFEKELFPANFIIEYTGQLRGWFYYLHVLSNALFKSECFKNVVVTGVLWGNDTRKMSKSFGNYPDPKETLENYGGDALRMYFLSSPIILGGDMNISERDIKDSLRKNVMLLHNVFRFFKQVASDYNLENKETKESEDLLDKWIVSRLNQLSKTITNNMEKYDIPSATRPITEFIDDLSTWYLRQKREKLNQGNSEAISTLRYVLDNLSKLIAPFMPFISEEIWQNMSGNNYSDGNKSVHLQKWPGYEDKKIEEKINEKMAFTREIVSKALKERDQKKIGLRWPLRKVFVKSPEIEKEYLELVKTEVNVKEIKLEKIDTKDIIVELDTELDEELEAEGYAREFSRQVQAFRKKLGLDKKDVIELYYDTEDEKFKNFLEKQSKFIKERTNSSKFKDLDGVATLKETFKNKVDFNIKNKRGTMMIVISNTTN